MLQCYATNGDETAFEQIVARYLDLVDGVARRSTSNAELAEEVTQNAFAVLARKAHRLSKQKRLGGWLMQTTRLESKKALRSEYRRRRHLNAFASESQVTSAMPVNHLSNVDQAAWQAALPHLDEALEKLRTSDREVILKRFFQKQKFRQIAATMNQTEDAARKHLSRALDRLAAVLQTSGHSLRVAVISVGLGIELSKPSAAAAATVAAHALVAAPRLSTISIITNSLFTMANIKPITVGATLLIALGTVGWQWKTHSALGTEHERLESKLAQLTKENPAPRSILANVNTGISTLAMTDQDRLIDWEDLIDAFDKTRFGGNAARQLFWQKLKQFDSQRELTGESLRAALDELEAAGGSKRMVQEVGTTLVMFADARDPAGCADAILDDPRIDFYRLGAALEEFGKQDPDGALAWYQDRLESGALDPKGSRESGNAEDALGTLVAGIAQTDMNAAVDYLRQLPSRSAERGLYRIAFALNDPVQRAALINALESDVPLQNHAILFHARAQIETESPTAAWEFLDNLPGGGSHGQTMLRALSQEALRDHNQAQQIAEWMAQNMALLPGDGSTTEELRQVVDRWRIFDQRGAQAWEEQNQDLLTR